MVITKYHHFHGDCSQASQLAPSTAHWERKATWHYFLQTAEFYVINRRFSICQRLLNILFIQVRLSVCKRNLQ